MVTGAELFPHDRPLSLFTVDAGALSPPACPLQLPPAPVLRSTLLQKEETDEFVVMTLLWVLRSP